jgi:hypothetical protein
MASFKAQSWPHGFLYLDPQLLAPRIGKKNVIRTWTKDDQQWLVYNREFMQCFQSPLAKANFWICALSMF